MPDPGPTRLRGTGGGAQLRLHAAIAVPASVARRLEAFADALSRRFPGSCAVTAPDVHLTFAHLGAVAEEHVDVVAAAIDAAARAVPGPTEVELGPLDRFGRGGTLAARAHVDLHVVLDGVRDQLVDVVRPYAPGVDSRAWHPHVTLVHGIDPASGAIRDGLLRPTDLPSWVASELRLVASLPAPGGSTYRTIHIAPFGVHASMA